MNNDFSYLNVDDVYADSACQALRPLPVQKALTDYYQNFNSCGERVKYQWGQIVDQKVDNTRAKILKLLKLSPKNYFVSFTQNTTYGLNLILSQIKLNAFDKVITSDIEHNSVFLTTINFAKKHKVPRTIISRNSDGSLPLAQITKNSLVVLNVVSNIDGRQLTNLKDVVRTTHKLGGKVILDAAQAMAHSHEILQKTDADAICFSAHKMYASSLGVIVCRKDLLDDIDISFLGGGMVDDVDVENYQLSYPSPNHIHTIFEPGLQAYGEIIALGAAIDWLEKQDQKSFVSNYTRLYNFLENKEGVVLINEKPSPVLSFHIKDLDSHLLAKSLSNENIMARSGYFCCHYYLDHIKHYPPLLRFSLGYHTRSSDIDKITTILEKL